MYFALILHLLVALCSLKFFVVVIVRSRVCHILIRIQLVLLFTVSLTLLQVLEKCSAASRHGHMIFVFCYVRCLYFIGT